MLKSNNSQILLLLLQNNAKDVNACRNFAFDAKLYELFYWKHVADPTDPATWDGAVAKSCRRNTAKQETRSLINTVLFGYNDGAVLPSGMTIPQGSCGAAATDVWKCYGLPPKRPKKTEADCIAACKEIKCKCFSCTHNFPDAIGFYVEVHANGHLVLENIGYVAEAGGPFIKIALEDCEVSP